MSKKLTDSQRACLEAAAETKEGTLLCGGSSGLHRRSTAETLEGRGLMEYVERSGYFSTSHIYRITQAGRDAIAESA